MRNGNRGILWTNWRGYNWIFLFKCCTPCCCWLLGQMELLTLYIKVHLFLLLLFVPLGQINIMKLYYLSLDNSVLKALFHFSIWTLFNLATSAHTWAWANGQIRANNLIRPSPSSKLYFYVEKKGLQDKKCH